MNHYPPHFRLMVTLACGQQQRWLVYAAVLSGASSSALTFLSDLPTPSFVIDMAAVHAKFASSSVPPIALPTSLFHRSATATTTTTVDPHNGPPLKLVAMKLPSDNNKQDRPSTLDDAIAGENSSGSHPEWFDGNLTPVDLFGTNNDDNTQTASRRICYGYVHCSVRRSLVEEDNKNTAPSTRLVELDYRYTPIHRQYHAEPPTATPNTVDETHKTGPRTGGSSVGLQLVLGLNNHHVGSYFWARSAGSGAAMEAPGIRVVVLTDDENAAMDANEVVVLDTTTNDSKQQQQIQQCYSVLEWQSASMIDCNSNDGKRSEWVRFLRPGDQVQLRPIDGVHDGSDDDDDDGTIDAVYYFMDALSPHIYGVSSQGRPLGSEPVVVCQWKILQA